MALKKLAFTDIIHAALFSTRSQKIRQVKKKVGKKKGKTERNSSGIDTISKSPWGSIILIKLNESNLVRWIE